MDFFSMLVSAYADANNEIQQILAGLKSSEFQVVGEYGILGGLLIVLYRVAKWTFDYFIGQIKEAKNEVLLERQERMKLQEKNWMLQKQLMKMSDQILKMAQDP